MNNELNFNGEEIIVDEYNLGITPEDALKRANNGEAVRKANDLLSWEDDAEIYDPEELGSFKITEGSIYLQVGDSLRLSITPTPSIANTPDVVWESSDYSIVSIDATGFVIAHKEGTVVIKASKAETDLSASISVIVITGNKPGPDKPEETENTEEQQEIEDQVAEQISGGTTSVSVENANNLVVPEDAPKAVTITGTLQSGATITNESKKSTTVNYTGEEPIDVIIDSPNASVTLKGNYDEVWSGARSVTINGESSVNSVVFDESLEGQGDLTVNAAWSGDAQVTSTNTNALTVSNNTDETVLENITVEAPRASVTMNGKWEDVEATVSANTLNLNASFHCNKLKVNAGNVVVKNCFPEQACEEYEVAPGYTYGAYTVNVNKDRVNMISNPGIYKISGNVLGNIVYGVFASGNYKYENNGHLTSTNSNSICLTRSAVNTYFYGPGIYENPNGYGIWKSSNTGEMKIYGGHYIADTHAVYAEKGTIEIYGGEFEVTCEDKRYVLNCLDANYQAGTANIIVYGGRFHDFDPANSMSEPGGPVSFLAPNHSSIEVEPGIWEVIENAPEE